MGFSANTQQLDQTKALKVKAAYLYNIPKFIEWPQAAFEHETSPFVIGVLGDDPFGALLDDTVRSKSISARTVQVRRFQWADEPDRIALGKCHLLYISASEQDHLAEIIEWMEPFPVLMVSDIDGFATGGGMIGFVLEEGRIVFEVNRKALEHAGLHARSELLSLARAIDGNSRTSSEFQEMTALPD